MTSISKIKLRKILGGLILLLILFPFRSDAQNSLTLSISPTLYDMSANPGQVWPSSLRINNVNDYDLTVYIEVVNFSPRGEAGGGSFVPVDELSADGVTLAEWFTITKEAVVIPRQQSVNVPFVVKFPEEAAPGGHFAALLVGTRPPGIQAGNSVVQTSQTISSLFFARVAGDVIEKGSIREFTTKEKWLGSPAAEFTLRFENRGNVHLQPQGEIKIYNMWGHERGTIPINQRSQFGNVLPDTIRQYNFTWKGEWSVFDIGRYSAKVALAYGTPDKQFVSGETTFWVIPFKLLTIILLTLCFFIITLSWLVKIYIRHVLKLAGLPIPEQKTSKKLKRFIFHKPLQAGILDLRQKLKAGDRIKDRLVITYKFIWQYKKFFLALLLIIILATLIVWFIGNAKTNYRSFEIIYNDHELGQVLSSEDIFYNQKRSKSEVVVNPAFPQINIINKSGQPGKGADLKIRLEDLGYEVVSLRADFSSPQVKTVILSKLNNYALVLPVSQLLNNALISPITADDEAGDVTILLGNDV